MHRATQDIEPEQLSDTAPFDRKLPTVAAIYQRHLVDIDYGFLGHFLTPCGLIKKPGHFAHLGRAPPSYMNVIGFGPRM